MKITFVMSGGFILSGGNRVISIYAKKLKELGHEVFIITRPCKKPSYYEQIRSLLKGNGLIRTAKKESPLFDDLDISRQILSSYRPVSDDDIPDSDVVIATWWETAEWVANLSSSKGAKVYFIQHYEVFDYFSPLDQERSKATWLLPLHKIIIAQWLVDIAKNQYGDECVSLVPNSVDTKQFYAPLRSKQSVPTVGMMYSKVYWKGSEIGLKAFHLAAQKIPNLKLVAFGGDEAPEELPSGAEYTQLPDQSSLKDIYSKCDTWLFSSLSEGFGMPILEAMACRTPVVGTNAGAAPDLLADGAGILINSTDPQDVARAIEQVHQLTDIEWKVMSDAAYARATEYTWDDAAKLFEAALYTAIERTQRATL